MANASLTFSKISFDQAVVNTDATALPTANGNSFTYRIVNSNAARTDFQVGDSLKFYAGWSNNGTIALTGAVTFAGYTVGSKKPVWIRNNWTYVGGGAPGGNYTLRTASLACYLRGTLIRTEGGERPIESLVEGDLILTRFGGLRPLKWLGQSRLHASSLAEGKMPVCISAGAMGDGVPARDLWVTADHNMMMGDRLVAAELLVNGVSITQPHQDGMIEIYHLDFGVHDCVLAEGVWADSFADRNNRDMFENYDTFVRAHPCHVAVEQDFCLPLLPADSDDLPGVRAEIAARIPDSGFSADPDLHLVADGQRIEAAVRGDGSWEFQLDHPAASLVLRSRVQVPAALGHSTDQRRLGIALQRIEVHGALGVIDLSAASRVLGAGVHPLEGGGSALWRWTSGDIVLPPYGRQAPLRLIVYGTGLGRYAVEGVAAPAPAVALLQNAA
jgi:hypothetical protein